MTKEQLAEEVLRALRENMNDVGFTSKINGLSDVCLDGYFDLLKVAEKLMSLPLAISSQAGDDHAN